MEVRRKANISGAHDIRAFSSLNDAVGVGLGVGGKSAFASLVFAGVHTNRIVQALKSSEFFADLGDAVSMMAAARTFKLPRYATLFREGLDLVHVLHPDQGRAQPAGASPRARCSRQATSGR